MGEAERDLKPEAAPVLAAGGFWGRMARWRICLWLSPAPSPSLPPFKTPVFWKLMKSLIPSLLGFLPLLSGEMGNEKEQMLVCSALMGAQTIVRVRMRLGGAACGEPTTSPRAAGLPTPSLP